MFEARLQRTFEAVGRKDIAAVMAGWADDGVVVYREFLFDPSAADEIWGAKPSQAA